MALIAMAVYSTEENKKDDCLRKTLSSLRATVDFSKHRLMVSVNGSTEETKKILNSYFDIIDKVIWNETNLGTAEAINKVWKLRNPGENAVKMDDDVVIHQYGWLEQMEEAIRRQSNIGIIGLKRIDCWENPDHENEFYRSKLFFIKSETPSRWIVGEEVNHVMGTCQIYNSNLLDKIGYLYQPKLYGFDDSFAAIRCKLAGFINVFLPSILIDHIDPGDTPYQKWKEAHAGECWEMYHQVLADYKSEKKSVYYNPFICAENNNTQPSLTPSARP